MLPENASAKQEAIESERRYETLLRMMDEPTTTTTTTNVSDKQDDSNKEEERRDSYKKRVKEADTRGANATAQSLETAQ